MKVVLLATVLLTSLFVKAQRVTSVRIFYDSLGNQTITVFIDSSKSYSGKLTPEAVEKRLNAVSNGRFATINEPLYETIDLINKEIELDEKLTEIKKD